MQQFIDFWVHDRLPNETQRTVADFMCFGPTIHLNTWNTPGLLDHVNMHFDSLRALHVPDRVMLSWRDNQDYFPPGNFLTTQDMFNRNWVMGAHHVAEAIAQVDANRQRPHPSSAYGQPNWV